MPLFVVLGPFSLGVGYAQGGRDVDCENRNSNPKEDDLTSRDTLLGRARLYQSRSETIPLDILADADQHGLLLTSLTSQP